MTVYFTHYSEHGWGFRWYFNDKKDFSIFKIYCNYERPSPSHTTFKNIYKGEVK